MIKCTVLTAALIAVVSSSAQAALVISKSKTSNVTCSGGICNATAADAVLNTKDLTKMLGLSSVSVFAEGAATDITVSDPFGWASSNQLTLGAYGSINVKAAISVMGTSGLKLTANAAATGGLFRLVGVGKISFWDVNSVLVINGTTYTLVNNLSALAAAVVNNPSGTYAFANDYDATQDGSYAHAPVPTTFNGVFEGLGNAINNLTIYNPNTGSENIALFSEVGSAGQLSDVNVTNISGESSTTAVSALVGVNSGTITHASATGAISPPSGGSLFSAAGLVFDNKGTITRAHGAVTITGTYYGAGIALQNEGTISISDASGQITASFVGGLVAQNSGTISDSNASGSLVGDSVGGIAETNDGTISTSYASGTISTPFRGGGLVAEMYSGGIYASYASGSVSISGATPVAGGLVGYFYAGSIESSFATGAVANGQTAPAKRHYPHAQDARRKLAGVMLGGLVGYSNGRIEYSYATGSVQGTSSPQAKKSAVGGLVGEADENSSVYQGYSTGQVSLNVKKFFGGVMGKDDHGKHGGNEDLYWDFDTSGIDNPYQGAGNVAGDKGLKGLSDAQFRDGPLLSHLDPAIWAQSSSINNGYPYLIANPPPSSRRR